jgi:TonB-linked SusC/RagA family outer membrane protein
MYKLFTKILCWPQRRMPKTLLITNPGLPRLNGAIKRQIIMTIKFTTILLLVTMMQASAVTLAQKITYIQKNTTLKQIFSEVKKQTGYDVLWQTKRIKASQPISANFNNASLDEVMQKCIAGKPLIYEVDDKTIVIKEKTAAPLPAPKTAMYAPAATITGVVKDTTGAATPGVSVLNQTTGKGAATDASGVFKMEASPGDVLVFSFVGFVKQSVTVGTDTKITVILKAAPNQLDQVVVTALGIKKSTKSLTYNVQQLRGSDATTVPDASFVNALAGKIAGATINASSSGIGGSTRVILRGEKSVFGNNNALYVLDGIPLPDLFSSASTSVSGQYSGQHQTGDGISGLNAEDIESIDVLTGASAAALYGSLAANGVILINTKSGTKGKTNINFSTTTNFYSPFVMPKFQDIYGATAPGNFDSWSATKMGIPSDYNPADYFQTGTDVINNVSVATGSDNSQTYVSAASNNGRGILPNNNYDRYNLTLHQTNHFLNDKLQLDLNLMYIKDQTTNGVSQGVYGNPITAQYLFPRSDNMEKYEAYEQYDVTRNFDVQNWPVNYEFGNYNLENPFWVENKETFTDYTERYMLGAGLTYHALNWLDLEARVRVDNNNTRTTDDLWASTNELFTNGSANGFYGISSENTRQTYADFLAKTHNAFLKDFTLNGILGASLINTSDDAPSTSGGIGSVPNLFTLNNIVSPITNETGYYDQTQAIFGSAELSYKSMVYLTVTGRNEWSSELANTDKPSFFYPSLGVSGIISDMVSLPRNIISYLKVRSSYSEVGNTLPNFVSELYYPVTPSGFSLNPNLPLTTLQPERTHSFEVGINSRFLNDYINFDLTLYNTNTFNQFFTFTAPTSSGINNYYVNAGQVNNKGIEAALGGNFKWGYLKWNPTVIFSLNRNDVVTVIKNQINPINGSVINANEYPIGSPDPQIKAGRPMGELYVTGAATDPNGYFIVNQLGPTDPNASIQLAPNSWIDAGNTNPRYNMSFRNAISYKNFSVGFLIDYRNGGVVESFTQSVLDYTGVSEATAQARENGGVIVNGAMMNAHAYYNSIGNGQAMAFYIYSATNARLREASISYTIPGAKLKNVFKNITLSVIGRNLFMFFNKAPFDPENTASTGTYYQGVDDFMQPSLRSFGFSVKLGL